VDVDASWRSREDLRQPLLMLGQAPVLLSGLGSLTVQLHPLIVKVKGKTIDISSVAVNSVGAQGAKHIREHSVKNGRASPASRFAFRRFQKTEDLRLAGKLLPEHRNGVAPLLRRVNILSSSLSSGSVLLLLGLRGNSCQRGEERRRPVLPLELHQSRFCLLRPPRAELQHSLALEVTLLQRNQAGVQASVGSRRSFFYLIIRGLPSLLLLLL
jgi:hypothetical protein